MVEPKAEGARMRADILQLLYQPSPACLQPSFICERGKKLPRSVKVPIFHPTRKITSESATVSRILAEETRLLGQRQRGLLFTAQQAA